jgi:putative flippase GtrA
MSTHPSTADYGLRSLARRDADADPGAATRTIRPGPDAVAPPLATEPKDGAARLKSRGGRPKEAVRLLKFALVGIGNTAVTFVVFNLCTAWLHLPAVAANGVGWTAGFLNSFLWNRSWTFADRRGTPARTVFLRFAAVNVVAFGVSEGVLLSLEALASGTGLTATLGQTLTLNLVEAAAIICALAVNYLLSSRWAFAGQSSAAHAMADES